MRIAGSLPLHRSGAAHRALRPLRQVGFACAAVVTATVSPSVAGARASSGGGVSLSPSPAMLAREIVVRKISCLRGCRSIDGASAGATLRFQGPMLARGKRVVYLGGAGAADDVVAQLRVRRSGRSKVATALVPQRATSGPVAIEITDGARSLPSSERVTLPAVLAAAIAPLPGGGPFFPIVGAFTFGTGVAAFGGGRGHQGQDIFAKCGTPLVAAEGGKVLMNAYQSRAGNYVVIDVAGDDHDEAYMHLQEPALVEEGADVAAGVPIGNVGNTGRADGCHLHFELWQGHWQGIGGAGSPIDPLPTLKVWAGSGPGTQAAVQ